MGVALIQHLSLQTCMKRKVIAPVKYASCNENPKKASSSSAFVSLEKKDADF